jgi:hypothetical protein
MNCLTDNTLRAYIDRELNPLELSEVKNHLAACSTCQAHFEILSATALRVSSQFASLDATSSAAEPDAHIAFSRFKANLPLAEQPVPFFSRIFSGPSRLAWAASLAAAVLFFSLLFPATRGFAQRLLATLRIQKVQTISLDFSSMDNAGNRNLRQALQQMISEKVVVTANEKELSASSREAASQLTGFPVRLISSRTDSPNFRVSGAHAFQMTVDRARLQDILDQAGRPDLILPATLDGSMVSVQIPRGVEVRYGNCKSAAQTQAPSSSQASPAPAEPCLALIQVPSPVVNYPSDLNLQQLAETALQLAGMTPVQARQFCQTVDWKSTLVLPIPPMVRSYETVNINGIQGTLLHIPGRDHPSFALIWVDAGIIYNLIGWGDSTSAVQLASSLD